MNKDKIEKLKKIIKPLEEYINEELCPHDKIIISQRYVEVVSEDFGFPLNIKD